VRPEAGRANRSFRAMEGNCHLQGLFHYRPRAGETSTSLALLLERRILPREGREGEPAPGVIRAIFPACAASSSVSPCLRANRYSRFSRRRRQGRFFHIPKNGVERFRVKFLRGGKGYSERWSRPSLLIERNKERKS